MLTIHFNLDDLPTASMIEPSGSQWHGLTLSELDEIDSIDAWGIRQFLAGCFGSKQFDVVAESPDVRIPELSEDKP
ncbi:MAG: hypothetical protein HC820_08265, partial [Hydrococcus sp. RM1_1_31]|nr:hypothetical protein [Hydrococcus sp. RM1_1_31]